MVGQHGEGVALAHGAGEVTFAAPGRVLRGKLLTLNGQRLTLKLEGWNEPVTVLRSSITQVQVRRQVGSRRAGAARGARIGLAVGAIAGMASGDDPPGVVSFSQETKAVVLGVLGLGVGALIGAAAGGGGRWETLDTGAGPGVWVSIAPALGGGVAAGLTLVF